MQTEITHRRVLAVALPIVLSNITVPLLGVVDTFAVGQIGMQPRLPPLGWGRLSLGRFIGFLDFCAWAQPGLQPRPWGQGISRN